MTPRTPLKESLNKLSIEVAAVRGQLISGDQSPLSQTHTVPVRPPLERNKSSTRSGSGVSRLANRLRTSIRARDKSEYRRMTDHSLDVVVESPLPRRRNSLPTNELLAILAPLISSLQRFGLSPDLESHGADALELRLQYVDVWDEVRALLLDLQEQRDNEQDELEMRSLLLVALLKKVHAEKAKHRSPLACIDATDPFVLHRNSATRSSGSTGKMSVASRAIGGLPSKGSARGSVDSVESEEYLQQSKATWQKHVHKIASFQNSALFSNSPVAVLRPPVSISPLTQMP